MIIFICYQEDSVILYIIVNTVYMLIITWLPFVTTNNRVFSNFIR